MTLQTVLDDIRERAGAGDVIPIIDPATEETITEFTDRGPGPPSTRVSGPSCRGANGRRSCGASPI